MKKRHLLSAMVLGLGLTVVLLLLLARPTTVTRADSGIYYVRAGATGDCISVTTPCGSIQDAINLATWPGEVRVATGTYTENLTLDHGVKLRGGWNFSFTVQAPATYPTTLDGSGAHVVSVTVESGSGLIEGFTIRNGRDGIHIYSGLFTLTHNLVYSTARQGIEVTTGAVRIESNTITDTAEEGISINGGTAVLSANLVYATGLDGIHTGGASADVRIHGNTVYGTASDGIDSRGQTVFVVSNTVHDTGKDGVRVEGVGNAHIQGNTVYNTVVHGIYARDVSSIAVITGNAVYATGVDGDGIYARGGDFTIASNTVHDTAGDGIHTHQASNNVEIHSNTVYGTASDGIDSRGKTVFVVSNTVHDTGNDGVRVEGVGNARIQGNTVYNTIVHGIYARDVSSIAVITGNAVYATGVDGDGIHTHRSSNNVEIHANTVYDTGDDGIDARGATVIVAGNTLNNCTDNGIKSEETGRTFVNANQVYEAGDAGIDLDDAGTFTVTNNVVAGSSGASVLVQTAAGPHNFVGHNTLVGSATGQQGDGISVTVAGVTIILANNAVVSHDVGINATVGAMLVVENTLLWANGDDPISGSVMIPAPPLFVAPAQQDYHLRPGSPAIDAGTAAGVTSDMDGDPRPIGPLPDIGADEFRAALMVSKQANPFVVQPGAPLTYTLHVTNTGLVTLTATITDTLPVSITSGQIPGGTILLPGEQATWRAFIPAPGGVWAATVVVTVEADYVGPLVNVVQVTTDEGATGIYTHTLAPDLVVTKRATPSLVKAGERLTYTIHVTNTGNFHLNATITDTLPVSITSGQIPGGTALLPGEQVAWRALIPAPGGVWTGTIVVTTEADYVGPLTNVVQVTTDEGAARVDTAISIVVKDAAYLPIVLRSYPPPGAESR